MQSPTRRHHQELKSSQWLRCKSTKGAHPPSPTIVKSGWSADYRTKLTREQCAKRQEAAGEWIRGSHVRYPISMGSWSAAVRGATWMTSSCGWVSEVLKQSRLLSSVSHPPTTRISPFTPVIVDHVLPLAPADCVHGVHSSSPHKAGPRRPAYSKAIHR